MTRPPSSNRLVDAQLSELAEHMTDPLIMGEFATIAWKHPRATREEKAQLILMAIVARLSAAPEGGIPRSEAKEMGNILWKELKALDALTPAKILETVLRCVEDFPPTTNSKLREELLREDEAQGSGKEGSAP